MLKRISLLGSTGSIGRQTLDIVDCHRDLLSVVALAAGSNVKAIEEQARKYQPRLVALYEEKAADDLKVRLKDTDIRVVSGMEGILEAATISEADIVLGAMVGMIGIRPAIAAIQAGKDLALANKETLVTAGHIITEEVRRAGVRLLPVDSEHSAIFQCLQGEEHGKIEKILITASGGPFRGKKREELMNMTAEEALRHPNWSMGPKVTIDSSTLVNKGLEVMEAHWLFDVPYDSIEVYVQPQSIIHSMVQFVDGAVMAQLGAPDMRVPIQYALLYPGRESLPVDRLDFGTMGSIIFEKPDTETFRGLPLALSAARRGGTMPTVFNAANEEAVQFFLQGRIRYLEITEAIEKTMDKHRVIENPSLDEILASEEEARELCRSFYSY
ncbi:MAG: 1-deoxy-D-xylulose-5-phosphate reductoisomerase [Lachnospiraceae bacterium]|nr:1-deoxy-D-xylulose-5-phosphate reductoisomerase [Lachnospiraceae bacterium]